MKKALLMLAVLMGVLSLGLSQAYAVPTIDGVSAAGEWDNAGYTYYLQVFDPNEADITPDTMDIARVVLLQELTSAAGGTQTTATTTDDGVYLLIEVFGTPTSLEDPDLNPGTNVPVISMSGDFGGDGLNDPFNLFIRQTNSTPFNGVNDPAADTVRWCFGSNTSCFDPSSYNNFDGQVGAFGGISARDRDPSAYEFFFPTGAFGTPVAPFPSSFIGNIAFDNGSAPADDIVVGQLSVIPEPSTLMLLGSSLLGLMGFGKFKFWQS